MVVVVRLEAAGEAIECKGEALEALAGRCRPRWAEMRALAVTGIEAVAAAMRSAAEKPATTVEATDDCFLLLSTFLSMLVKFLPLNSTSFDMMMLMMRCGRHATSLSKHASRCVVRSGWRTRVRRSSHDQTRTPMCAHINSRSQY